VRKGRVVGIARVSSSTRWKTSSGRSWSVGWSNSSTATLEGTDIPREIRVPELPDDPELYQEFLGLQRGSKVRVRVPRRGAKRQLMDTVTQNAHEAMARPKLKRASDHNARARALVALQRTRSVCPKRRCASSATTSRTSRAPRSWRPWS